MDPDSTIIRHLTGMEKDSSDSNGSKENVNSGQGSDNRAYEPGSEVSTV